LECTNIHNLLSKRYRNSIESQWALCPAALLPELQPAPCFLSAIIGQT